MIKTLPLNTYIKIGSGYGIYSGQKAFIQRQGNVKCQYGYFVKLELYHNRTMFIIESKCLPVLGGVL